LETVEQDIISIAQLNHISMIYLIDSDLFIQRKRGITILDFLERHINTGDIEYIYFEQNVTTINPEIAKKMAQNPLIVGSIGLQSTNLRVLNAIGRQTDFKKFSEKIAIHREEGNILSFDVILGLPYDTDENYLETLDFVLNNSVDSFNAFILYVLPGSTVQRNAVNFGIKHEDTPPFKLLHSKHIQSLSFLEKISVWTKYLVTHQRIRDTLAKLPKKNRLIDLYIEFISFLLGDEYFNRFNVTLDYRGLSDLHSVADDSFVQNVENNFDKYLAKKFV